LCAFKGQHPPFDDCLHGWIRSNMIEI
jgi:hypothetical protein